MDATHGKVRGIRLNLCAHHGPRLVARRPPHFSPFHPAYARTGCVHLHARRQGAGDQSLRAHALHQLFAGALRLTSSTTAAQAIATASSRSSNGTKAISEVTAGTR